MGFIREFLKFVIGDFKSDYTFLRDVCNGDRKIDLSRFKKVGLLDIIKANWLMFILCAAFFCSGYMMAAKDYQDQCNTFVTEEIIPQCKSSEDLNSIINGTFDFQELVTDVHLVNISDI